MVYRIIFPYLPHIFPYLPTSSSHLPISSHIFPKSSPKFHGHQGLFSSKNVRFTQFSSFRCFRNTASPHCVGTSWQMPLGPVWGKADLKEIKEQMKMGNHRKTSDFIGKTIGKQGKPAISYGELMISMDCFQGKFTGKPSLVKGQSMVSYRCSPKNPSIDRSVAF